MRKSKQPKISSDSKDEDCLCIVCFKSYSESKSGQDLDQFTVYEKWVPYCTGNDLFYIVYIVEQI